jgi:probable F420-dependent oxidoreductase
MKPRIAVFLQPQHAEYNQIREAAIESEEIGADAIYNWDHFYPLYKEDGTQWNEGERREGKHFECWTMLSSWGEVTNRVDIGPLVTCNSYRNPELLADMARTVDHISNGRAILGIGSGWFEQDYEEYGYEFGTPISRLHALERSLERIVKRMKELNPQPKRKIPILIGGGGEKVTLRITAQYADIWHGFATKTEDRSGIETVAHKNSVLDNWCKELGRDPKEIKRSIGIDIKRIDLADELLEAGATEVTLAVNGPGYDLTDDKEWIAWRDSKN